MFRFLASSSFRARGFAIVLLAFCAPTFAQTIPAFPGAEGAGAYAKGGRGGDVYHVTNLNASGAGSLAYGLTTGVPAAGRTIVFDVSGYAHISGTLRVTGNKITIAGQTAPGDGFGLKDGTFLVSGDDIVIRHLRFRDGNSADSVNLDSNSIRSIFDHCDALFSNDENMSSFGSPPEDMTFQWSLNAWGMESHSCGGLWDQNHATSHHSLWAHNHTRNPKGRTLLLDWVNNVTFDWDIGYILGDSDTPANWNTNVVKNYFIAGTSGKTKALEKGGRDRNGLWNFHVYLFDNRFDGNVNGTVDGSDTGYGMLSGDVEHLGAALVNNGVPVTQDDPLTGYKKIVSAAGPLRLEYLPSKPLRDEVANLLINELVAQTHHHVSSVAGTGLPNGGFGNLNSTPAPVDSDGDGMPDFWETALGFNTGVANNNTAFTGASGTINQPTFFPSNTPLGYTQLEEYLHFLAIPHAVMAKSTSIDIDLKKFTYGFTVSTSGVPINPAFTLSGLTTGTAVLQPDGHTVRFTPDVNYFGRARFDFTVNDGVSNWTQTMAILVSNAGVPRDLTWVGGVGTSGTNIWTTSGTNNIWTTGTGLTSFGAGDSAAFDDSGSNTPSVTLVGSLSPGGVSVESNTNNYVLSGSGSLAGGMKLVKSGLSTLSLNNTGANSFTGGVVLNGGALNYVGGAGLGSGPLTLTSGTLTMPSSNTLSSSAVNVLGPVTIIANAGSNFINAPVSGSEDITFSGNSTLTIAGSLAGYSGTLRIPSASMRFRMNQGATAGASAAIFNLGANATLNNRAGGAVTVNVGALLGGSNAAVEASDQSGNFTDTYAVGQLNQSTTFAGSIRNGSGAPTPHTLALTKVGTGTLLLTGSGTYTGPTFISAGTLLIDGTLGNTAVTGSSGTTLGGSGKINGPVTILAGAVLDLGGNGAANTLRFGSGLTLNGATVSYDLSNSLAAGSNDLITLSSGTVTIIGTVTIKPQIINGYLTSGTYTLIGGSASAFNGTPVWGGPPNPTARQTFVLDKTSQPGNLLLVVTGSLPANLIWQGNVADASSNRNWDIKTTVNWLGADGKFYNLDTVTFDDSSANSVVTIPASTVVQPQAVAVNTGSTYTIRGHGSIGGQGILTKTGTGTLVLAPNVNLSTVITSGSAVVTLTGTADIIVGDSVSGLGIIGGTKVVSIIDPTHLTLSQAPNRSGTNLLSYYASNTYTGGTQVINGTLQLNNADGAGSGIVTLAGGALNLVGDIGNTVKVIAPSSISGGSFAGDLIGNSTLNLAIGANTFTVYGDMTLFTGTISLGANSGYLRFLPNVSPTGSAAAAFELGDSGGHVLNRNGAITVRLGSLSGGATTSVGGATATANSSVYEIGGNGASTLFAGKINDGLGTLGLVKVGAGTLTLSGSSSYSDDTIVKDGTLSVAGTLNVGLAGGTFDVLNGAILNLAGGTITTDNVHIFAGATLSGCGTLNADLTNEGTVLGNCGGVLRLNGDVVNNGTVVLSNGTVLQMQADGNFTNAPGARLDVLNGGQVVPAGFFESSGFVNNGTFIDASSVNVVTLDKSGATFDLTIQSYSGHNYHLQRSSALTPASWQTVMTKAGTDGVITLSDPSGATGAIKFYRVLVSP